jgi:hypothetical protein
MNKNIKPLPFKLIITKLHQINALTLSAYATVITTAKRASTYTCEMFLYGMGYFRPINF